MSNFGSDIDAALSTDEPISRDDVIRWINGTPNADLSTLAKLYRLTDEGYHRIQPDLGMEPTCALIQRYLLECIRQNVIDNDEIQERFEAASSLHIWLRHLLGIEGTSRIIEGAAKAVTNLYIESGEEIRYLIETGFLEHALETAGLRSYFERWASDVRLQSSWKHALAWADDHPNYMWNLLQKRSHRDGE